MGRTRPLAHATSSLRFQLVEIHKLRGHERIRPSLLESLTEQIRTDRVLKRPILAADRHFVILDGHHRVEALRALGCKRVPVYLVDYESDAVTLGTWPDAVVKVVTKREVIRRGLGHDLFPPKTTRHGLTVPVEDRPTPLEQLQ